MIVATQTELDDRFGPLPSALPSRLEDNSNEASEARDFYDGNFDEFRYGSSYMAVMSTIHDMEADREYWITVGSSEDPFEDWGAVY